MKNDASLVYSAVDGRIETPDTKTKNNTRTPFSKEKQNKADIYLKMDSIGMRDAVICVVGYCFSSEQRSSSAEKRQV